jgi:hypothetical protein
MIDPRSNQQGAGRSSRQGLDCFWGRISQPGGRPAVRVQLSPSLGYFLSVTPEDDQGTITLASGDLVIVARIDDHYLRRFDI